MNRTHYHPLVFFLFALGLCCFFPLLAVAQSPTSTNNTVKICEVVDGKLSVSINGDHFTTYDFTSHVKPVFYPVLGPQQLPMTRGFPLEPATTEQKDHPHQKSIWTGHIINGVDFWTEKGGSVQHQKFLTKTDSSFTVRNHWVQKGKQEPMLSDETTYRFGGDPTKTYRWLDAEIKLIASHGDFTLNDTKEGLFAIRTHPALRLKPFKKARPKLQFESHPEAINSEGVSGKSIWGQKAKWVAYAGAIRRDSETVETRSVYFFDHPNNFGHPTTWQAREYGLVAANPFGLHYFQDKPKGFGSHTIKNGESITLRYRVVFHSSVEKSSKSDVKLKSEMIDAMFERFASPKLTATSGS